MSKDIGMERAYVKFSRPTGPYVIYIILLYAFVIVPSWLLWQGKPPHHLELHEDFYYLAGSFFGFYVGGRSWEKVKSMAAAMFQPQPQGQAH